MQRTHFIPPSLITVSEDKTNLVTEYSSLPPEVQPAESYSEAKQENVAYFAVKSYRTGVVVEFFHDESFYEGEDLKYHVFRPKARKYQFLTLTIYNT